MPRGVTQENINLLEARIASLQANPSTFRGSLDLIGIEIYLEGVRGFRPKGFQLHFFKNACPLIPNSILELFFEVSPAQVSIVNTSRDVYMDSDWDSFDMNSQAPNMGEQMTVAQNMCWCLGYNGITNANNNVPQIRNPRGSELNEEQFSIFKETLLDAFQAGYSAMESRNVSGGVSSAIAESQEEQARINEQILSQRAQEQVTFEDVSQEVDESTSQDEREQTELEEINRINLDRTGREEEPRARTPRRRVTFEYTFLGYCLAMSGNLYNRSQIVKRGINASSPITRTDKVYVFYFGRNEKYEDSGSTSGTSERTIVYQLQWGNGNGIPETGISDLQELKSYFKNQGADRLSLENTLQMYQAPRETSEILLDSTLTSNEIIPKFKMGESDEAEFDLASRYYIFVYRNPEFDAEVLRINPPPPPETFGSLDMDQLKSVQAQTFTRGFGVEIEGNFDEVSKDSVATLLTNSGFNTKSTGYHGRAPSGYFKLESDGSVRNDMGGTSGVFEMVSPLLRGEQGLDKLSGVLAIIRSQGARTSPSAGTHVHFGYADFGDGDEGFQKRKRLIVNYCVLQPFLQATQIMQSRNRYYARTLKLTPAKIKKLAEARDYRRLRDVWREVGGGRGALHLKENSDMSASSVPTYEFRFPASNFESDTITNMVRLIEKIWSASIDGYLPHSVNSSKPLKAEEWLEDLLGQELFSFWKNRYRDLQTKDDYVRANDSSYSDVTNDSGTTVVSSEKLPKLNHW